MQHFISVRLSCAWRASIHRLAHDLLASEIALHFQNRCMAKQKLNLFKLASTIHDNMGHLALVSTHIQPKSSLGF